MTTNDFMWIYLPGVFAVALIAPVAWLTRKRLRGEATDPEDTFLEIMAFVFVGFVWPLAAGFCVVVGAWLLLFKLVPEGIVALIQRRRARVVLKFVDDEPPAGGPFRGKPRSCECGRPLIK